MVNRGGMAPQRQSGFVTHAVKVTTGPTCRNKLGPPSKSFAGQQRLRAQPLNTTNARSFQRGLVPSSSKHTKPQSTQVLNIPYSGQMGAHLSPSREQTRHLYYMLKHTTQQVNTRQHDQDDALFKEGRRWCIKETATAAPFKETHEQPLQPRDKPRVEGAATDIDGTP